MNIFIFEKFVRSDLPQALDELTEDINLSEQYNALLKHNKIDNGELIKESLSVVSGLFGSFTTALGIIETEKRNKELLCMAKLKEKYDKEPLYDTKGNKRPFNVSIASKEAEVSTTELRRIRNIIQNYKVMNEKNTSTLQSLLRAESTQKKVEPSN